MSKAKKNELAVGVMLSYASTVISLLSTLLLTPIIIRMLGKSDYGLYETIGSFVNYLAIFDLGFSSVVTRYTAKYEAEEDVVGRDKFLYTCRNIYRFLCLLIFTIGIIVFFNLETIFSKSFTGNEIYKAKYMYIIVLLTTMISIYSQVYKGALNGIQKFIFPRILTVIKTVATKIVCILVLYLGADSVGYTFVLFVFEVLLFISVKLFSKKFVSFKKNRASLQSIKELMGFTFFIFLQVIVSQIFWQVDKLLLGVLVGTASVAIYAVALNINNIIRNVSSALRDVILPKATHIAIKDNNDKNLTKFMISCGRLIFIIYGLLLIGFTVLGKKFILLWIGSGYEDAYIVMLILSWGAFLPTVQSAGEEICRAYNKHKFLSIVYFVVSGINVVFTYLLIPKWGLLGAAVPTALSLIVGNVIIANIYYKTQFSICILEMYKGIFGKLLFVFLMTNIFAVTMNYIFYTDNWTTFIFEACAICVVYLILLLKVGLNTQERQLIKKIVDKIPIVGRSRNEN